MHRVLLLLDHRENRRLLLERLPSGYHVTVAEPRAPIAESFDLAIVDGPALTRLAPDLVRLRQATEPVFLPSLLVTSRHSSKVTSRVLGEAVDDVIALPADRGELEARVAVLLHARDLSLQLRRRNEDLETFVQALTHDLRAPARIIQSFAEALIEDKGEALDEESRRYLERIRFAASQMTELVDALLTFGRLEHETKGPRPVSLLDVLQSSLRSLAEEIDARQAQVVVGEDLPVVQGDSALLKSTLTNLISNAMKFVPPGTRPRVTVSADRHDHGCRVAVGDNGIGISSDDQARLFSPFVRLHGEEEYPGIGLGLSTVRKAVELMGGSLGIESAPEGGSVFWFELPCADVGGSA